MRKLWRKLTTYSTLLYGSITIHWLASRRESLWPSHHYSMPEIKQHNIIIKVVEINSVLERNMHPPIKYYVIYCCKSNTRPKFIRPHKGPQRDYYPCEINHQNECHFPIVGSIEVRNLGLVFQKKCCSVYWFKMTILIKIIEGQHKLTFETICVDVQLFWGFLRAKMWSK